MHSTICFTSTFYSTVCVTASFFSYIGSGEKNMFFKCTVQENNDQSILVLIMSNTVSDLLSLALYLYVFCKTNSFPPSVSPTQQRSGSIACSTQTKCNSSGKPWQCNHLHVAQQFLCKTTENIQQKQNNIWPHNDAIHMLIVFFSSKLLCAFFLGLPSPAAFGTAACERCPSPQQRAMGRQQSAVCSLRQRQLGSLLGCGRIKQALLIGPLLPLWAHQWLCETAVWSVWGIG